MALVTIAVNPDAGANGEACLRTWAGRLPVATHNKGERCFFSWTPLEWRTSTVRTRICHWPLQSGAHEAPTNESANHASAELSVAINVLELFTVSEQVLDSKLLAVEGVLSLLNLAKSILDDGIGSLP